MEIYHNVQRHSGGCRHRLSPSIERRMKRFCQTALKNFLPRRSRVTQQISLFQILIEFNYSIISNFHNNVVYDRLLLISSFLPFVDPSPVYGGEGGVKKARQELEIGVVRRSNTLNSKGRNGWNPARKP